MKIITLLAALTVGCTSSHGSEGEDGGTDPGEDGSIERDDGSIVEGDGSIVVERDGSVIGRDGGRPDGAVIARDGSTPMTAQVGTPCDDDSDCPGLFCSPAGSGFGYCSWICADAMPCPGDAVCVRFDPAASYGYCMDRCTPAAPDCAPGNLCQPGFAESPVCYPGCSDDSDCPSGTQCGEGVTGIRSCFTPGSSVGDECRSSDQCPEAGYCIDENGWGAPRGLCVTFCDLDTGAGCESGTTCVSWGFASGAGSCIPTCDDATPCRAGYDCVPTGEGDTRACVARCTTDDHCEPGNSCNFVTGVCGG